MSGRKRNQGSNFGNPINPRRRRFVGQGIAVAGAAGLAPGLLLSRDAQAANEFTEWGWPLPYKTVSSKSVAWLKSKGWWPLQVGWNPLWSDGNVTLFVMNQYKLLQKRGIEAEFPAFLAAALFTEVYVPGRIQVAQAGSLGLLRAIDLKIPTAALATYPAQRQAFLVHPDSPLKTGMAELKGQKVLGRPAVIGVTIGSTPHLGLLIAAKILGLEEGKDYILKNTSPPDIITMPKGIDIVGIWEPNVILMTEFLKNARILELIDKYEVFNGYTYMRGEIEENAPDVVQAYADAFVEAQLYARLKTKEVLAALIADPSQTGRNPKLIERDIEIHVTNPKPTKNFLFENADGFWIPLEAYQSGVMADAGVLKRRYTEADFKTVMRPKYMADTYARLGWNIPSKPPFLPADWKGVAGRPPYPDYGLGFMGPQPFPGPGDLQKDWTFGGKTYKP
jgi:ABC-type nitrate/sulfonate/bicarbonate transport system substrate-binding protein